MKLSLLVFAVCLLTIGCTKDQKPDNNSMTRYTESLHQDVSKAEDVAKKANELNASLEKTYSNLNEQ